MWRERDVCECKGAFDGTKRSKARLVKEVVALANTTGGCLVYGVDSAGVAVGVDGSTVKALDPARVGDYLRAYITDQQVTLEVVVTVEDGATLVVLDVAPAARRPIVMERDGNVGEGAQREQLFRSGDVLVRDHTQARVASRTDFDRWREDARRDGERAAYEMMRTFVERPEGTVAVFAPPDTPGERMRRFAVAYQGDRRRLLGNPDLILAALEAEAPDLRDEPVQRLLVQSSLRKRTTLWWWLAEIRPDPDWLLEQLHAVVDATDRDVSDAGKPLLEVAALSSPDGFDALRSRLQASERYKHFREAAEAYPSALSAQLALDRRTRGIELSPSREECLLLLRPLHEGQGSERSLTKQLATFALVRYRSGG